MDILEGGSSFCLAFVSLMTIFSFVCGLGLPTFIRVLLLALKYMEGSLFQFSFCLGDVLRVASIVAASLAKISGDFSFCCPFPRLPVESPVVAVFWLPVEAILYLPVETVCWLPVEPIFPDLACLAGGAFYLTCVVVSLGVPLLVWTFFQSSMLYSEIFFFPWVFVPLFLPQF